LMLQKVFMMISDLNISLNSNTNISKFIINLFIFKK